WPSDGHLVVPGLANKVVKAYELAQKGRSLPVTRSASDLIVDVPPAAPDAACSVVALEISGDPIVYSAPEIVAASDLVYQPIEVSFGTMSKSITIRYTTDGTEPTASSPMYSSPFQLSSAGV